MSRTTANDILHADHEMLGPNAPYFGAGVEGRPVLVTEFLQIVFRGAD